MLVNENNLVKTMANEAGHGGYHLSFIGGEAIISGRTFMYVSYISSLPRKVLGAIVEHKGYIPEEETCLVIKTKDGYEVQNELPEALCTDSFIGGNECKIKNTGVSVWGYSLWIGQWGTLKGVSPNLLGLINGGQMRLTDVGTISVAGDEGDLYLKTYEKSACNEERELCIWEALEQVDWWKSETECLAACEQMEVEEA